MASIHALCCYNQSNHFHFHQQPGTWFMLMLFASSNTTHSDSSHTGFSSGSAQQDLANLRPVRLLSSLLLFQHEWSFPLTALFIAVGRSCTCNQSPVDAGLITVLIWHPAAFIVLARTHGWSKPQKEKEKRRRPYVGQTRACVTVANWAWSKQHRQSWRDRNTTRSGLRSVKVRRTCGISRQSLYAYVMDTGITDILIPSIPQ